MVNKQLETKDYTYRTELRVFLCRTRTRAGTVRVLYPAGLLPGPPVAPVLRVPYEQAGNEEGSGQAAVGTCGNPTFPGTVQNLPNWVIVLQWPREGGF